MLAIYKRELRSFFHGMMGYVLTAFLLAASGIYFLALNLGYGLTDFGYYTLYRTIFMLLLYFPVLAMRSLAEERRARTDQLLLTSPVSVWGIVVGKYLALCTVFALPCLADGIMIARGDLGVEVPLAQVPIVQKRAINIARKRAKPVIVATHSTDAAVASAAVCDFMSIAPRPQISPSTTSPAPRG